MATPLTATHRIETQWINDGILHTQRAYCERGSDVAGIPYLKTRNGGAEIPWLDACNQIHDAVGQIVAPTASGLSHQLQERSGSLWLPIAFTTTAATGIGTIRPASEFTLVLRDTAFKKIRVVLLETAVGYIGHSNSGLGLPADTDLFVGYYNGDNLGSDVPYQWQKSRGNNFILGTGAVAGGTYDLNDKIKRSRGLE